MIINVQKNKDYHKPSPILYECLDISGYSRGAVSPRCHPIDQLYIFGISRLDICHGDNTPARTEDTPRQILGDCGGNNKPSISNHHPGDNIVKLQTNLL